MNAGLLLPLSLFLPLLAALHFALSRARPEALAARSLALAWIYAGVTGLTAWFALASDGGIAAEALPVSVGVSGFQVAPSLFLDGRGALFLLLLGLCLPVVFTFLRNSDGSHARSHHAAAWALAFSLAGVFLSDSLLLFYFFWEAALVSVYFWIGLHGTPGHHGKPVYPVLLRFVLFTLGGSLPMLVSIAAVCAADFGDPGLRGLASVTEALPASVRGWVFLGFFLGFAVKLPLFGFHGWLRDTYNVAPPACRALLSAAMSKMGAFGLILVLAPAFPLEMARYAPVLLALAAAGALYGGLIMLAQDRLIDMLAYASLSHLSLLALGVFAAAAAGDGSAAGLSGAVLLTFSHALIMAALFSLDARALRNGDSADRRLLSGLRSGQGRLYAFLLLAGFASASLPGLANFPGEVLVLFSAFASSPWLALAGGLGALLGAAALVRLLHAVWLGEPSAQGGLEPAPDLTRGETGVALALSAVWLALGLYPMLLLGPVERAFSVLQTFGWTG